MVPTSTYRVQLEARFDFAAATALVDYLDALGVGALYTSPILRSEPGSLHGYDCVDPSQISPELGGEAGLDALSAALSARRMGLVVDFVPNHMGIASHHNALWYDVLEYGRSSRFADYFDIDWNPTKQSIAGRILLPILGDSYGSTLERGELVVSRDGGTISLQYFERRLPLAPATTAPVLERAASRLELDRSDPAVSELLSIVTALRNLPGRDETDPTRREELVRETEVARRRLAASSAAVFTAIDAEIAALNGAFDELDAMLSDQAYRLSNWRVALETINYRRFFDVNQLAAIRMEDPAVFEVFHACLLRLVAAGKVSGIRLDHTDGLFDPTAYFAALRGHTGPDTWIVAEKILSPGEALPPHWRVDGTTGYELGAAATQVLFDARAVPALDAYYRRFTGDEVAFAERKMISKRLIVRTALASELQVLARMLERIADGDRRHRDLTLGALVEAITETIAAFPVYRTYLRPDGSRQPRDDAHLAQAIGRARRANPSTSAEVFDFLADVLALRVITPERVAFVMKLQQLTGPAMAKAVEDTAFYVHGRFIAANEVGGDPAVIGMSPAQFHAQNEARLGAWPRSMTSTSTHDTKRGEDARARLAVLTEMPDRWRHAVSRWSRIAQSHKDESGAPSRSDEYVFYQALLGARPFSGPAASLETRLSEYLLKAAREAKTNTSWINMNAAYEEGLKSFVQKMMRDPAFVDDFAQFAAAIGPAGATNGLAQCVLKLCSPGVPDIYRGAEVWDQSLVDPDNRRPIDYALYREMLASLEGADPASLLARYPDGAIKMFVTTRLLRLRREHTQLFLWGEYRALEGEGVVAFSRSDDSGQIVCVVPRLPFARGGGDFPLGVSWGAARLEGLRSGEYVDALTGAKHASRGVLELARVFAVLPVAVLASVGRS